MGSSDTDKVFAGSIPKGSHRRAVAYGRRHPRQAEAIRSLDR